MSTRTLLEMVQQVAIAINSDEVTSLIDDSIEVQDITRLTLNTLEDLMARNDWEFLTDQPMQLEAGTNVVELAIPATVRKVQTVKYRILTDGTQTKFRTLYYMRPAEMMEKLQSQRPTDDNTDTVTINGVELYVKNNQSPRYWTSFDEANIIVDSYDTAQNASGVELTDSAILATIHFDFTGSTEGTWVAPIPPNLFSVWLQEAIAECSVKLRQVEDPREERKARRSYIQQIRKEPVTHKDEGSSEINYGRRR